ncbi:PAS domain S-box protein, partial [bacterium]|nr:PAS domain S-box protein [bacterium]
MSAGAPKRDLTETETDSSRPDPEATPQGSHWVSRRARALADFLDSSKTALRRSGLPTRVQSPAQEDEPPELLDLLLEGPDAVVVLHRTNGEIEEANYRFAEWAGVSRESLHGKPFLDFFPEAEHKAARTLYEDAGAGGVHVVELPNAIEGTRSRLVEFTAAQSKSGQGMFAIVIGRDVGERAATERYLRAERDRLNLFIRAMRDSLILLSPTGDILYANPTAEQMFETYELPVICHRWLQEFSKEDKSDLQGLASAYEGRTLELEGSDGRIFLVTRSFLFEAGHKTMLMLMAKDITDQRLVERQNQVLAMQVVRDNKLAEFGTLSAGIAHNLNGPLMGVLGFCDLIELKYS